jgi:hypothetical protein
MSTPVDRARISAENGKKSRGPKTESGKRIAARNATRHGLLAKYLLLDRESAARFRALVTGLHNEFQPQTPAESAAVDNMALCSWRQMRIWTLEHAAINHEMARQQPDLPEADAPTRAALAFRTLADHSATLALLNRYETSYDRQFSRALRRLLALREARKANLPNEPDQLQ